MHICDIWKDAKDTLTLYIAIRVNMTAIFWLEGINMLLIVALWDTVKRKKPLLDIGSARYWHDASKCVAGTMCESTLIKTGSVFFSTVHILFSFHFPILIKSMLFYTLIPMRKITQINGSSESLPFRSIDTWSHGIRSLASAGNRLTESPLQSRLEF